MYIDISDFSICVFGEFPSDSGECDDRFFPVFDKPLVLRSSDAAF